MDRRGNSLDRSAWITAGLTTLQERGYAALSVNALAKSLGVTKGSFYYHFEDKEEFEAALLEDYVENMTLVMGRVIAQLGDPVERLRKTLELHIESAPEYTLAFRAWGMVHPKVSQALNSIDQFRLRHATALFEELGFSKLAAETRARVLVTFLFGELGLYSQIDKEERMNQLDERLALFLRPMPAGRSDQQHDHDTHERQ